MRRTSHPASAFTLIELMAVVAVIGMLVSLLLPAVQSAREAARRSQCVNNLVQIGVALYNYESTHEVFPPGVVDATGPILNTPKGYHHDWITQILPFLQQANAYRKVDFVAGVYDPENATVRAHVMSTLLCPSDGRPPFGAAASFPLSQQPYGPGMPGMTGNNSYAACHHDVEAPIDVKNSGVFYLNSRTRPDDITDGAAYTILVGEKKLDGADLGWMSGTRATLRNAGSPINATPVRSQTPTVVGESSGDGADAKNRAGGEDEDDEAEAARYVGGFSSFHSGGANFLFGDGSVRFLSGGVNQAVLRRLANRADGELVEPESY
jgi:prepilin-type processing-associated H-X9-DG protein/prepilin-type N-terminal cleavage/methylation domain-containing protein